MQDLTLGEKVAKLRKYSDELGLTDLVEITVKEDKKVQLETEFLKFSEEERFNASVYDYEVLDEDKQKTLPNEVRKLNANIRKKRKKEKEERDERNNAKRAKRAKGEDVSDDEPEPDIKWSGKFFTTMEQFLEKNANKLK